MNLCAFVIFYFYINSFQLILLYAFVVFSVFCFFIYFYLATTFIYFLTITTILLGLVGNIFKVELRKESTLFVYFCCH